MISLPAGRCWPALLLALSPTRVPLIVVEARALIRSGPTGSAASLLVERPAGQRLRSTCLGRVRARRRLRHLRVSAVQLSCCGGAEQNRIADGLLDAGRGCGRWGVAAQVCSELTPQPRRQDDVSIAGDTSDVTCQHVIAEVDVITGDLSRPMAVGDKEWRRPPVTYVIAPALVEDVECQLVP